MKLETNLLGRLKNTSLPFTSGLLPLFEAVVNSIHSIEEAQTAGHISVEILRAPKQNQLNLEDSTRPGPEALPDITGFKITDDGIGFTDGNMESFRTLDSDYKASMGGRGIGRLLWLKAFNKVVIESRFQESDGKSRQRSFVFDAGSGVSKELLSDADEEAVRNCTVVHLDNFDARYRENTRKSHQAIADSILEHCLWYFIREGGAPEISIKDDGVTILLDEVFESYMHSSSESESIQLRGNRFGLIHVKLRSNSRLHHSIAYCANNRLVTEERLSGKIPGIYGKIRDSAGELVYLCYVSSRFLDEHARPERIGFDIPETTEPLLESSEIGMGDIRDAIVEKVKSHLSEYINANAELSKERVKQFVSRRAPRYRPILSRIPEAQLNIDPEISDKELDLTLHRQLASIESELLAEGHDLMAENPSEKIDEYRLKLQAYLQKAEDIKKSDLAGYVSHRRVILDLLEKAIQRNAEGKYEREELIHQLIMPMRMDSNNVPLNAGNLWLLDERLAFHDYLASDKPLASVPITGSSDKSEPDLVVLNVFDQPILVSDGPKMPLASLEIIEIKRPMRNDSGQGEEHDPIEQAIGYLQRIRAGGVKTATGRPIPASNDIPGFCYILADLTPTLISRCELHHDLTKTADNMGYFGYKKNMKAFIEVISFDRLVNAAKERNRAFFDKLGLPAN